MNAISRLGWTPVLELWEEAGTIMDTISTEMIMDTAHGEIFPMFYVRKPSTRPEAGRDEIHELLADGRVVRLFNTQ